MSVTPVSIIKDALTPSFDALEGGENSLTPEVSKTDAASIVEGAALRRINEAIAGAHGEDISFSAAEEVQDPVRDGTEDAASENDDAGLPSLEAREEEETPDPDAAQASLPTFSQTDVNTDPSTQMSLTLSAAEEAPQQQQMLTSAFAESMADDAPNAGAPSVANQIQQVLAQDAGEDLGEDTRQQTSAAGQPVAAAQDPTSGEAPLSAIGPQHFQLSAWSSGSGETSDEEGVIEDPNPEPEPEPAPAPVDPTPTPIADPDYSAEAPTRVAYTQSQVNGASSIDGGRVTTMDVSEGQDIGSIRIVDMPEHGHVSVNPDNSLAIVMSGSDFSGAMSVSYEVTYANGTTQAKTLDLNVVESQQQLGWGQGEHYMLAEDANGDIIVETGENHRKVYVTAGDNGLTRAEIADREGLTEAEITGHWLHLNGEYGATEELALAEDVAMDLWQRMSWADGTDGVSHWMMFERGYTYDTAQINLRDIYGESELHPVHFTAWGEGDRPIITKEAIGIRDVGGNQVISDLTFHGGVRLTDGDNIILHNIEVTHDTMGLQHMNGVTLHDSQVHNIVRDAPMHDDWNAFADRETGLFMSDASGVLMEGNTFHHNAWADDYLEVGGGQPPNLFSHNIYLQNTTFDVTFTNNITSQGASFGAQFRGGVWAQDNAFVDNNAAVNFYGGDYQGAGPIGNFTYFADNVITSAGHKEAVQIGAVDWGIQDTGRQTTLLDNIVAHLANPDDPTEIDAKWGHGSPLQSGINTFYDDTVIYEWHSTSQDHLEDQLNQNVDGLDRATLDQVTIQRFAATVLGDANASIQDLMDYILALPDDQFGDVSAQDIVDYFQQGFNLSSSDQVGPETHRFIPNDLAEGQRWQSNINWHDNEVPSNGDNVLLGGNAVHYGGTLSLSNIDFGDHGELDVVYGKLTVTGAVTTSNGSASLDVEGSGQFWTNGLDAASNLDINVTAGRFANTGDIEGNTVLHAQDGDVLLGVDDASYVLTDESELRIDGSEARVGFDGENGGVSVVKMEDGSTLTFVGDADGFASIEEFRSGALGDDVDVQSGIRLDGTLQIDLSDLGSQSGTHTLIDVDAMHGIFNDIKVFGLASTVDAEIIVDYDTDAVTIELTTGSGAVSFDSTGNGNDGTSETAELWAGLTVSPGIADVTPPTVSIETQVLADPDQAWI